MNGIRVMRTFSKPNALNPTIENVIMAYLLKSAQHY